jgi:serpin B
MNDSEEKLRSVLAERAGSVRVGDPADRVTQRVIARRHRRRRRTALGSAALAMVVTAAALVPVLATSRHGSKTPSATPARPSVLVSHLVRDTRPTVAATAVSALTAANTSTAIDLYHQLATTPGNLFFSPYSIETALSMAVAGARGTTRSQMLAVLHDTLPAATLQDATNALNLALLAPRAQPTAAGEPLELALANSVWSQTGYHIEPGFLDLLARDYGAALNTVDYERDSAGATKAINDWVDTHTNHKIKDLLSGLDPATRLVLVNAVHFKASWTEPFEAARTRVGSFTTATGTRVTAPFMHGAVSSRYASGAGWQAVDLPYIGGASMTVIVPDAGTFPSFERSLDAAGLARIVGSLAPAGVTLALPKFRLTDRSNLVPPLQALGMTAAFQDDADFSGITGSRQLFIGQAVHQATVTVDEKGTEAAAATALAFSQSSLTYAQTVTVDRPFIVVIRDQKTGSILFLGRITDPTQTSVQQP